MVTKKIMPRSISVTVIRKNTENAEVLLKSLSLHSGRKESFKDRDPWGKNLF